MYKKIFAAVLAVCMVLTALPMVVFATEAATVTDEAGLKEAAAAGGEITTGEFINVTQPIEVTKDLTINLGGTIQQMNNDAFYQAAALFIVKDAKLTINGAGGKVSFAGAGSTFVLQEGASLELVGGSYTADATFLGDTYYPTSLIDAASGTSILLNGGGYTTQTQTGSHYLAGVLLTGEGTMTVKAGSFYVDPAAYVAEGGVSIKELDQWQVLAVAAEYGAEFNTLLNENKELVLNRYQPSEEEGADLLVEALNMAYLNEAQRPVFTFHGSTYDFEKGTIYASLYDLSETHLIQLVFKYDAAIKEQVDALVEALPDKVYNEEAEEYLPYTYPVRDLELFNYWMTCNEENQYDNINGLINYSDDFKQKIGYKNFRLDIRAGDGDFFYTYASGIAEFKYNGTVYAAKEMNVQADHLLYVSDETEDTAEAMLAAVRKRLNDYLGVGKVTVESLTAEEQTEIGYEGYGFKAVINACTYYFLAERNSEKMVTPTYKNVDVSTEVTVLTEDGSVPLDTMIEVEQLTEGEEYEAVMGVLDVDAHETYDIQLHSGSMDGYVTSLENGEFAVQIPISEELKDQELTVYYVDENGEVETHAVTVEDDIASFVTNHFSIYTLAVADTHPHAYVWDAESKQYICSCNATYRQDLDLNGNNSVGMEDAILLLRTVDGLNTGIAAYAADINSNGKVNVFDAVRYLQLMNA